MINICEENQDSQRSVIRNPTAPPGLPVRQCQSMKKDAHNEICFKYGLEDRKIFIRQWLSNRIKQLLSSHF